MDEGVLQAFGSQVYSFSQKSQSNGHATSVKDKTAKSSSEVESSKTSKQSPKQQPKDAVKEQAKKKDAAPQQPKEKAVSTKKAAVATPKQSTPKKSSKEAQETQKKTKKQEKFVEDNDGRYYCLISEPKFNKMPFSLFFFKKLRFNFRLGTGWQKEQEKQSSGFS